MKVVFDWWRPGMQKIRMTEMLRDRTGMSLSQSKAVVDSILDGQEVSIDVSSDSAANEIVAAAEDLGVKSHIAD